MDIESNCSSNQIVSELPKWLAENVEGVNQSVKQMLEIIEHAEDSSGEMAEIYYQKRPELIALIEEINQKHQFLAERYDLLIEDLQGNAPAGHQMQNPESTVWHTCKHSSLLTPDQKLGLQKIERRAISFDFPLSSGGSSSNVSVKEDFESSFVLSSDSDSGSYHSSPQKRSNLKSSNSGEMVKKKFMDMETGLSGEFSNGIFKVKEIGEYDLLLSRITEYEEKLRISNQKLGFSEDEISRLKSELKKNSLVNMENLKTELERAKDEVKMREDDLKMEKKKVLELEKRVTALENEVFDSSCEIATLVKELEITRKKLGTSEEELSKLNHDISKEISQSTLQLRNQLESTQNELASEKMQVRITRYKSVISDCDYEIRKLTAALQDSLRNSETEKSKLQFHNSSLSEKLTVLEARFAECEVQIKSLENEIKQSEATRIEMKELYEAREMGLQGDIEGLKAELNEKHELVELLNKNLDGLKWKYDMLMTDKDGLNAKVQTLSTELSSRDNTIQHLEGQLHQLQLQQIEQIAVSENSFMLRDELRLKVQELEKEVEKQTIMLSDRAEEKREAIRQLCFSLEHYRTGYQELREAYINIGQRRHAVIAS